MYHSLPLQDLDKVGHEESSGNHHHQAQRRTRQIGIEDIKGAFTDFPLQLHVMLHNLLSYAATHLAKKQFIP